MASIGPQLPPHLLKRKRTPDDEASDVSDRPSKTSKPQNEDEIALEETDSDSDDGFGPSAPARPAKSSTAPRTTTGSKRAEESSSGTVTGTRANTNQAPQRVMGPSAPPADLSTRPRTDPTSDPDSGSDADSDSDDYGPALPTASSAQGSSPACPTPASASADAPTAPQRDAWMLAPPAETTYRERDPAKLRARKFASGKAASSPAGGNGGDELGSIWTETPEDRKRRLANAVLGRGAGGGGGGAEGAPPARRGARGDQGSGQARRPGQEVREGKIQSYTESTRGKSLYEEHQSKRRQGDGARGAVAKADEDDPSQRPFDREKDMALGGAINDTQRRDLLRKAGDFGGRFSKGNYL
jgi:hypothetical protein